MRSAVVSVSVNLFQKQDVRSVLCVFFYKPLEDLLYFKVMSTEHWCFSEGGKHLNIKECYLGCLCTQRQYLFFSRQKQY